MSPERFEAMGVDVVVGGATEAELEAVGLLFEKLDRTFSRFRPDSELNRVNAAAAEFVAASPIFARVLGWRSTPRCGRMGSSTRRLAQRSRRPGTTATLPS